MIGPAKPEIVIVKWHDARYYPDTRKRDEIKEFKMALFESLGYLISQDETTTVLASEANDEEAYRDITLIPTGSIQSIERLSPIPIV